MVDLLEGNIPRGIIKFAFPMFVSNLFQLLYNTADAFIVGNFIGSTALAAVGSSDSLIFLMVGFFQGLSMGSGVVCARFFGCGDGEELKKSIQTTVIIAFVTGLFLTVAGVIFAPCILEIMKTPKNVLPESTAYLRAYMSGGLALVIFNMVSGVLQSTGDSKTPMKFLILSSVLNVGLDIIFISVLHLGVEFAGFATVISQSVSAIFSLRVLFLGSRISKKNLGVDRFNYRISLKTMHFDRGLAVKILKQGIPSGVQMSVISIANAFVQFNINSFGSDAMAGCGAQNRVEGFVFLPIQCFTIAISTFVSQNLGAQKFDRLKKGIRFSLAISLGCAEFIGIVSFIFAPIFVGYFSKDPEVIGYGVASLRDKSLFYFLLAYSHCSASIMRGYGKPVVPMIVMLAVWCIFRVSFIIFTLEFINSIHVVFMAYPLTWFTSSVLFTSYIIKIMRQKNLKL